MKLIAFALAMLASVAQAQADQVKMLTYHNFPPFITGPDTGLTFDLAAQLTKASGGQHEFVVGVMPRKRLEASLADREAILVPWVTPAFFEDEAQVKYIWSATLLADSNAVISPRSAPVNYSGPGSLIGKVLGGVNGHRYEGVDALVEAGKIRREDVGGEVLNLRKAAEGRIDATIIAATAAHYLMNSEHLTARLYVSATPHSRFDRKLFITGAAPSTTAFVIKAVNELAGDPEWKAMVARYLD